MSKKQYSREEISQIAKSVIGKTRGEINNNNDTSGSYPTRIENSNNKGLTGQILEEAVFGYKPNSKSGADFEEAGVELKVTPYKKNKNGTYSAKERLVLNIINYMEEHKLTFENSSFWTKNNTIQIIWYLFEKNKHANDMKFTHELLFTFPEEDLYVIQEDWKVIVEKIKTGKAHELSESDTNYLGACTKGANASSIRQQPFSDIHAKQRAFSLKASYMTQLVRQYVGNDCSESVVPQNLKVKKTFQQIIEEELSKYIGWSESTLVAHFKLDNAKVKNIRDILLRHMLGVKGNIAATDEFLKANIIPKTIKIEENGRIVESMSFPTFKYTEIVNEQWEDSTLRNLFETTKFMFTFFQKKGNNYYFDGVKFWNMPVCLLDKDVKHAWEKTKDVIVNGNIVKKIKANGNRSTNFPGMSENDVCHVRPHAQDSNDTYPLPITDKLTNVNSYTKHCFWLNNKFIATLRNQKSY